MIKDIKKTTMHFLGKILVLLATISTFSACEKFVEVDRLETQIFADQVFENDAMANAAITGLYRNMRGLTPTALILNNSLYANDITPYSNALANNFYILNIQPNDSSLPWSSIYSMIYGANNALEKLSTSAGVPATSKSRYIAEAKFIRAMGYFYLINLFGDVPLALTPNVNENMLLPRTSTVTVYNQIIKDLKEAKADLPEDYSHAANERVRANKWVASALLARVYLYQKEYVNAEAEANAVISSGKYALLTNAIGIYNKNNNEAIFQFANNSTEGNTIATSFIYTTAPSFVCTNALLNAFEAGDQRKTTWLRTTTYAGQPVSIPYKFTSTAINPTEYITFIRLAEMYLIRAEAKNYRNDFQGCADDVNLIRFRHGALTIPQAAPSDQNAGLTMVMHERQIEFFTEGCHRFFDLKRTERWSATMQTEKTNYYKSTSDKYPIPLTDMQRNPNLKQNPGYE